MPRKTELPNGPIVRTREMIARLIESGEIVVKGISKTDYGRMVSTWEKAPQVANLLTMGLRNPRETVVVQKSPLSKDGRNYGLFYKGGK